MLETIWRIEVLKKNQGNKSPNWRTTLLERFNIDHCESYGQTQTTTVTSTRPHLANNYAASQYNGNKICVCESLVTTKMPHGKLLHYKFVTGMHVMFFEINIFAWWPFVCAKRCSVVQITKSLDHYIVTSLKHEIIVKMSHVATKRMKTGPACASCVSKIPTPNPPMEKHGSPRSLESVKSM